MPVPTFCNVPLTTYVVWTGIVALAGYVGNTLEANERDRCSRFRDKSKMFGGHKKEGEAPSWGEPYKPLL